MAKEEVKINSQEKESVTIDTDTVSLGDNKKPDADDQKEQTSGSSIKDNIADSSPKEVSPETIANDAMRQTLIIIGALVCLASVVSYYQIKGLQKSGQDLDECFNPSLIGDNVCDEALDNPECLYDGGDCSCLNAKENKNRECLGLLECDKFELVGDGFCNDETNTEECSLDGGDCCHESIEDRHCKECICKTTGLRHWARIRVSGGCAVPKSMIGDGYCHDWANIEACEYDGNDCCLPVINDQHCTECKCHLNGLRHPPSCQSRVKQCFDEVETMEAFEAQGSNWKRIANGQCERVLNTHQCLYDGGDCCQEFTKNPWGVLGDGHKVPGTYDCVEDGTRHKTIDKDQRLENCTGNLEFHSNRVCNEDLNNPECLYDGNDCCLPFINDFYAGDFFLSLDFIGQTCTECICHLDEKKHANSEFFTEKLTEDPDYFCDSPSLLPEY